MQRLLLTCVILSAAFLVKANSAVADPLHHHPESVIEYQRAPLILGQAYSAEISLLDGRPNNWFPKLGADVPTPFCDGFLDWDGIENLPEFTAAKIGTTLKVTFLVREMQVIDSFRSCDGKQFDVRIKLLVLSAQKPDNK